ncbi:MAG: hypothetical protein QHH30_00325 [candidate division NC10 bacterium]|nr:hypothetical protein [candidate division NC10 bacterium]
MIRRASILPFLLIFLFWIFVPLASPLEPIKGAKVGEWAEYQMSSGGGETSTMRRSVVGKEGNLVWFETKTVQGDQITIMKILLDPNTGKAKRAIVKNPPERAMEIPLDMVERTTKTPGQRPTKGKAVVTQETITTPAGTFQCTHVRDSGSPATDGAWSSERVPLGGLVKSKTENHTMVLTAFGSSGAKTEITETPRKMPTVKEMIKEGIKEEFVPSAPIHEEED